MTAIEHQPADLVSAGPVKTALYHCKCGKGTSLLVPQAQEPPALRCPCGAENRWTRISYAPPPEHVAAGPHVFVKGFASTEYRYDPRKSMGNNGAKFGRTPEQQHRNYERIFATQRKLVEERRAAGKEGDWEYLGGMPGEMHDAICDQEGDKNIVQMDPVPFLKANGLFMGKK